jgi:biotin-dependent carboxylase-like uncharacterized protein
MALIVIEPGLSTTVQDAGRPGFREWGVPIGGAFDRHSAELAGALAGNPPGSAVLEMTLSGGTYHADCPMALALAGAPMPAKVVDLASNERMLFTPASFTLATREKLVLGRIDRGARTYLAVKGGWQTPLRLGSRSSERRIRAGEILPAAPATIPTRRLAAPEWRSPAAEPFHIIDGPDSRAHPELDPSFWVNRRFRVSSSSNRMGLRLQGDAVPLKSPPERLSSPVAPGAIQVAGGQLILLGVACGTMGGYPHVAHIISADLDRLGQIKSGDQIEFRRVTIEEARQRDATSRALQLSVIQRLAMVVDGHFD